MVIFNSFSRNIINFLIFPDSGPLLFLKTAILLSLYNPMSFFSYNFDNSESKLPTNSQTSAPSYAPIVTSNSPLSLLIQVCWSLKSNDFLAWWIIALSSSRRRVYASAKVKASFSRFSVMEGNSSMSNMTNLHRCLLRIPLKQPISVSVLLHWFKPITSRIFLFAVSKIALLIHPSKFLAGFINLNVGLLLKCYLWSFIVIKLLFSPFISNRFSASLYFKICFPSILICFLCCSWLSCISRL